MVKSKNKNKNDRLFSVNEAASILKLNPEVLRRKLRSGVIFGIKLTPKVWKIPQSSITEYLNFHDNLNLTKIQVQPKNSQNCNRFPRWIEYSGLPKLIVQKFGPSTWIVFKKIIEIDCFENEVAGIPFKISIDEMCEVTGLTLDDIISSLNNLKNDKYIKFNLNLKKSFIKIVLNVPLKTPKNIYEIPPEYGGVKDQLKSNVLGTCITRFLIKNKK